MDLSIILPTYNEKNNINVLITDKPEDIIDSTHIILPGQGAFKASKNGLLNTPGMIDQLSKSVIEKNTPFLSNII